MSSHAMDKGCLGKFIAAETEGPQGAVTAVIPAAPY
jgi:hypothetical protein